MQYKLDACDRETKELYHLFRSLHQMSSIYHTQLSSVAVKVDVSAHRILDSANIDM